MSLTYTEMIGQYAAMERVMDYVDARLPEVAGLLHGCGQYVFVGCGSSHAVACSAALMARLRLKKPSLAIAGGDLLLHADTYRTALEGSGLVVLSRSGETSEVIRALERVRAMDVGAKLLGIACTEGSALSVVCDFTMKMPWCFDQSVCQTRTVSCLYLCCAYSIAKLAGNEALQRELRGVVAGGPAFLAANEPVLADVAQGGWTHAVVLGDAELSGLCEEGALAFKEICQVPSNAYPLLDVRHGPMVLIGNQTLVIAALSARKGTPGHELELNLLRDILAKGATVVTYSDEPAECPGAVNISFGRELSHISRGLPVIAVCQLTSYYKSLQTGTNPDQPDGLSPWIALA